MTRYIAEVGSNHNGSLVRAAKLIDDAAEAGFSGVKFQQFSVRRLFRPEALAANPELLKREALELPIEWHEQLSERAHEKGLQYGVTPFYPGCISALNEHADFFKVASYSLLDKCLLVCLTETGKPVIISTGMATMKEVTHAVRLMQTLDQEDITLLHCLSAYPAPATECNLKAIDTLRKEFKLRVGWSDHTTSGTVIRSAIWRWGADPVELHFDLEDRKGIETEHSWTKYSVQMLRGWMHDFPSASLDDFDGDGVKQPAQCELEERKWRADPSDGFRPMLETICPQQATSSSSSPE